MAVAGEYADGQSSRVVPATLSVTGSGIVIQTEAGTKTYPADAATISSRLGKTPRYLTFPDGAQFETPDNDGIDELLAAQVGRSGLLHTLESHLPLVLIAAIVTVLSLAWVVTVGIPRGADYIAHNVSQEVVDKLGANSLQLLDRTVFEPSELPADRQAEIRAFLQPIIDRHSNVSLHFRAGLPNAYALPDASIVLTDGLFDVLKSPDEIKAIVYHEIGHVEHRHLLRRSLQGSAIAVLLVLVTGDLSNFDLLVGLPALLVDLSYSREFELEADRYALDALAEAGMDVTDFRTALVKLTGWYDVDEVDDSYLLHYLSTHPHTEERLGQVLDDTQD